MLSELFISRFFPKQQGQAPQRGTGLGSTACDLVAPNRFEMSRAGRRFMLCNHGFTGIAPVQQIPTVAAQWVLWNDDNAKCYAFEEVGMYLTSGTPGVGGILMATLFNAPTQHGVAIPGTTAIVSASGSTVGSQMAVASGISISSNKATNWYLLATNPSPNVTAFAGSVFLEHRNLQGGIVVPPQWGLALSVVAPAGTTPLFAPFATWVELEADLE